MAILAVSTVIVLDYGRIVGATVYVFQNIACLWHNTRAQTRTDSSVIRTRLRIDLTAVIGRIVVSKPKEASRPWFTRLATVRTILRSGTHRSRCIPSCLGVVEPIAQIEASPTGAVEDSRWIEVGAIDSLPRVKVKLWER